MDLLKRLVREIWKAYKETPSPQRNYDILLLLAAYLMSAYVTVELMNVIVVHRNDVYLIVAIPASLIVIIQWINEWGKGK